MSRETTTLAEWVSYGYKMGLLCHGCRKSFAMLTGDDVMARFGDNLLATVADMCERAKCPCGHVGCGIVEMAHRSPEVVVNAFLTERVGTWLGRDLYLRKVLAEHGRPLEIADMVWAKLEARAGNHPQWVQRMPATEVFPLSEAGDRSNMPASK